MAVGVGFEPTMTCAITVFKTAAFVHSAIPPYATFALPTRFPRNVVRYTEHTLYSISQIHDAVNFNLKKKQMILKEAYIEK